MYDQEFAFIYDTYGWDTFSITMGNAILEFLESKNVKIKKHLDLACGVGTLCHLFSKEGIPTKGIDISGDMIEKAKEKYPEIPFKIHNMITYQPEEKYDLITCTCDAINHIVKEGDLKDLFRQVYSALEEDGYFIFDSINKKEIVLEKTFKSERGQDVYVEYYLTKKEKNLINNNLKVYQKNKLITEENIIEKIYPCEQIIQLAKNLGFQIIKCDSHIMNEQYNTNNKTFWILKK